MTSPTPTHPAAFAARLPPVLWVAVVAALVLLPRLGASGLWEPGEASVALAATGAGDLALAPPATRVLAALAAPLGVRHEAGLRALFAVLALATVLVVYAAGARLGGRAAGLLAAGVLLGLPLFVLQARQLTSDMPLVLALALSAGGLTCAVWGAAPWWLAAAAGGLGLGVLAGGALVGLVAPAAAVAAAWLAQPRGDRPRGRLARGVVAACAALAVAGLVVGLGHTHVAGSHSWLLGGVPRLGPSALTFEALVRQTGFGLFPWSALAFFALGRPFVALAGDDGAASPHRGPWLSLLFLAVFALVLSTLRSHLVGATRFAALAPIALALGLYLDEARAAARRAGRQTSQPRWPHWPRWLHWPRSASPQEPGVVRTAGAPVAGTTGAASSLPPPPGAPAEAAAGVTAATPTLVTPLLAAVGTLLVARDLFLGPEELLVHTLQPVRWPVQIPAGPMFLGAGVLFAALLVGALVLRRRLLLWGVVGAGVVGSVLLGQVLVPALSRHLSPRAVVDSYRRAAGPGEPLGRYRVEAGPLSVPETGPLLASPPAVATFLRRSGRAFALIDAAELPAVDEALQLGGVGYVVLDARSSRLLLLSNRASPGQPDANPLRASVWVPPPPPREGTPPGGAPPAHPPWPAPRVAAGVTFGDAVELTGADFPAVVRRPGPLALALRFRVLRRPPPGYSVFVHLEQPGLPRVTGDHEPVGGAFPTAHWLPGQQIDDRFAVALSRAVTPRGRYQLLVGLWPGGTRARLPITAGPSAGDNRALLGEVTVQ